MTSECARTVQYDELGGVSVRSTVSNSVQYLTRYSVKRKAGTYIGQARISLCTKHTNESINPLEVHREVLTYMLESVPGCYTDGTKVYQV